MRFEGIRTDAASRRSVRPVVVQHSDESYSAAVTNRTGSQQTPVSNASKPTPGPAPTPDPWYTPWVAALNEVRQAVVRMPALPTWTWLIGCAAVVAGCAASAARSWLCLRRAQPAPYTIRRDVARAARRIGLARPPETLVVDARISPLVWCGLRPRLVLPRRLWDELDDSGRSAVLCHELAHLKRRDHWVRWGELAVCIAYWWHPLAWWVRRRISDEAENCCDTWVTWLLPQERRAYAEALLHANEFTNRSQHAAAPMGLGVLSGRAKRMARRITMVMTHTNRPGLSGAGLALVGALAMIGWSTTPLWACPKKAKAQTTHATPAPPAIPGVPVAAPAPTPPTPPCAPDAPVPAVAGVPGTPAPAPMAIYGVTPEAVVAPGTPAPPAVYYSAGGSSSYQDHITQRRAYAAAPLAMIAGAAADGGDDEEVAARLRELETQLQQLHEQLAELHQSLGARPRGNPGRAAGERAAAAAELRAARAMRGDARRAAVEALRSAAKADKDGRRAEAQAELERAAQGRAAAEVRGGGGRGGEPEWRTYRISAGKLEAFTALMARDDVPIIVRPGPDAIEIQATRGQHRVIAGFLRAIEPEMSGSSGAASEAEEAEAKAAEEAEAAEMDEDDARGAAADPMETPEVPSLAPAALFQNDVLMPVAAAANLPVEFFVASQAAFTRPFMSAALDLAAEKTGTLETVRQNAFTMAEQIRTQAATLLTQADALAAQEASLRSQAESISESAVQFADQAQVFIDQANSLEERAAGLKDAGRESARSSATALRDQATGMEAQVRELEARAEALSRQIEALESEHAGLREAADALRTTADQLLERFGGSSGAR
jgi:beta-lactamase regulating signal transducer with metallopeptidase domain/uncharacterized coiled-coil DUF342 family protein